MSELDRELNDVFPEAEDLLYYFLDAPTSMSQEELTKLIKAAGTDESQIEKVIDFLLYYGVIGVHSGGVDHFIYSVNYDLRVLKIRAERDGDAACYVLNAAFWPVFGAT